MATMRMVYDERSENGRKARIGKACSRSAVAAGANVSGNGVAYVLGRMARDFSVGPQSGASGARL